MELAPGDEQRKYLKEKIDLLRKDHPEMVFISFPGDEKSSGVLCMKEEMKLKRS